MTQTGAPVEKGKEVAKEEEVVEAEGDKLPEYKDEGVVPPPEKTEVVQGEEVKQPTDEVRFTLPSCLRGVGRGSPSETDRCMFWRNTQRPAEEDAHAATKESGPASAPAPTA